MGPEDAARGREGTLGAGKTEGASWMRRRRVAKAFMDCEWGSVVGVCVGLCGRSCRRVKRR